MWHRAFAFVALVCGLGLSAQPARADDAWSLLNQVLEKIEDRTKGFPQVYRIQFRVYTSKRRGADSDAWVRVSLNRNVHTYLDLPGDDFERGTSRTYDLMFTDNKFKNRITKLGDIQYLNIQCLSKNKDWAIVDFQLLVNGQVVYSERFKNRKWLGSHYVSGRTLRAAPQWRAWRWQMPSLRFSRAELEQRTAAFVGHFMHESKHLNGIYWGDNGRGVRIIRRSPNMLRLHLDLCKRIRRAPDPDFDVDLDIQFSSTKDRLDIRVTDVRLKGDGPVAKIGGVLFPGKVRDARRKVRDALLNRTLISIPLRHVPFRFHVHTNGDVELVFDTPATVRRR